MGDLWKWIVIFCAGLVILGLIPRLQSTLNNIVASSTMEKSVKTDLKMEEPSLVANGSSSQVETPPSSTLVMQEGTLLCVCPPTLNVTASDGFTINISVINVSALGAYEFKLRYDSIIISATEVNPGDLFPKDSLVIMREIDSANGIVRFATCAPLGSSFVAYGNGTLATVRFHAISSGNCTLNLYDSMLVHGPRDGGHIAHRVIDAQVWCKIYEHETAAYLDAPTHVQPGSSCLITGVAVDKGICNETDVSLQLLIDGNVVNSTTASTLTTGSSINLTYAFVPTEERIYNLTAWVKPVPNEEYTQDNLAPANVVVRTQIRVPQDYATIQEAIDNAVSGETISVSSGEYHEHLGIDKSLTLLGESCNTTIIDGSNETKVIVVIQASHVKISGFTIRNGGGGILLDHSNSSVVTNSFVTKTLDGLSLLFSYNCTIGFDTMKDNERGLFLGDSDNNTIQHNDFINNTKQASTVDSQNSWDNGAQGNYWSDYRGTDTDGDGIGNTPYVIDADNNDNYPLMTQNLD